MIKRSEVERLDGFGFPQAQDVAGADAVPRDRSVVGHTLHFGLWNPAHARVALLVSECFRASAKFYRILDLGARDFPRVAVAQPFVRDLALPAVADDLIENPKLVADAVADRRHFNRRKRIHVT